MAADAARRRRRPRPRSTPSFAGARRIALDDAAWVEHVAGWVDGADALFEDVVAHAPWEHRTVRMYDRMVDEPRLTAWYGTRARRRRRSPDPRGDGRRARARATTARSTASAPRCTATAATASPGTAIASTRRSSSRSSRSCRSDRRARCACARGERRGETRPFPLLPGDLFVMGGATQATWEHAVPKVARAGARVSVQFRHST